MPAYAGKGEAFLLRDNMAWHQTSNITSHKFVCGHCGNLVGSSIGFQDVNANRKIYVCPHCDETTYIGRARTIPGPLPGSAIQHLPSEIEALYVEARSCVASNCFTASVLVSRKLLMNIGVEKGADEGLSFVAYVEYLAGLGYVPPNGRGWVDHIRKKGNEANHEIVLMSAEDATELISFLEMLLKFIYEFPTKIPSPSS